MGLAISALAILRNMPPWSDFFSWGVNLALAGVFSVVFYLLDIWAPGDAKLFILLASLYPQRYYAARPGNIFPSLSIVVYAFAVGYLYLICSSFWKKRTRLTAHNVLVFNRMTIINTVFTLGFFIGFQMLIQVVFPAFAEANYALILLTAISINYLVESKTPALMRILGLVGIAVGLGCGILTGQYSALLISVPFSIVAALVSHVLINMASFNSYREIPGDAVRPGIILSLGSIVAMQKCIDPNIPRSTTENRRSRINNTQAEAVKKWCRITKSSITIVEMLPFVPFILVAVIIEPLRLYLFS